MATTITAPELTEILSTGIAQGTAQAITAALAGQPQQQQPVEQAEAIDRLSDLLNPYRNLTREQIIGELRSIGITNFTAKDGETQAQLSRKLNMLKAIEEQADAIYAYQQANPSYVDAGFERRAFDIFVKTIQVTPKGIPTHQTYKYIPRSIPQATVKLNQQTGNYDLSQGSHTDHVKKWVDAERWALKGGHFGDELSELRKIRAATEKKEIVQHVIFKARKL